MRLLFQTLFKPVLLFGLPMLLLGCKKEEAKEMVKPSYHFYNGFINGINHPAVVGADGNLLITGMSNSGFLMLLKTTPGGEQIFRREIYIPNTTNQFSIAESGSGKIYILTSSSLNFATSKYDMLLIQYDAKGDTLWTRFIRTPLSETGNLISGTKDGGLILCGQVQQSGGSGITDFYVRKMDAEGNEQWSKSFYTNASAVPTDIIETSDGNFMMVGYTNAGSTYMLKVDPTGTKLDENIIVNSVFIQVTAVVETADHGFMCCGGQQSDVVLLRTDAHCEHLWTKNIGYSDHSEFGYKMVSNGDGSVTVTGSSFGPKTSGQQDILVMRASDNGDGIWYRAFGGKNTDIGYTILKDKNKENLIVGISNSFSTNASTQIFTVAMDNAGNFK